MSEERRVQIEIVLRILKQFIQKLKISFAIPMTLANSANSPNDDIMEKYLKDNNFQIKRTYNIREILMLLEYIDEEGNYSSLWYKYTDFLSERSKSLIELLDLLSNIAEERLASSALSDLSKEKKLNKLNRNINNVEKSIAEYSEKLRKQKIVRLWNLAYKGSLIQKYEEDLAYQKWNNNLRIKQEIVRSSKNIRSLQELGYGVLKELEAQAIKKRNSYDNVLRENLSYERDARIEKNKLLFQLQTHIRKYDQNIGDKMNENLRLQEEYNKKKQQFDEFLIEYNRQEEEYKTLLQQKEKEDQLVFEQKLMVFMMSRAARVIQVYWRRFRRDQKKKSKKGKGKGKRK